MPVNTLFSINPPIAMRQPTTDRLALLRLLDVETRSKQFEEPTLRQAHGVVFKWAGLESHLSNR